jgi:hypothetical protein
LGCTSSLPSWFVSSSMIPSFSPLKFGLQSNLICLLVLCSTGKRGRGDLDLLDGDSRFCFCFCLAQQEITFWLDWEKPGDKDRVGTKTGWGQNRWGQNRGKRRKGGTKADAHVSAYYWSGNLTDHQKEISRLTNRHSLNISCVIHILLTSLS